MLNSNLVLMIKPVEDVLANMESISIIKVALGERRTELMKVSQGHAETFRIFSARVRGKAEICNFGTLAKSVYKTVSVQRRPSKT